MFSLTLYFMKKNKKYSINNSAFKNFVDREGTTPTTVSKAIGKANGYWGMNCYNGSSMDASTMCQLCNTYGLSPLMFFNEDEKPMKDRDKICIQDRTKTVCYRKSDRGERGNRA